MVAQTTSLGEECKLPEAINSFLGQPLPADPKMQKELFDHILALTHFGSVRLAGPGIFTTGDYRNNRITVLIDEARVIRNIGCG